MCSFSYRKVGSSHGLFSSGVIGWTDFKCGDLLALGLGEGTGKVTEVPNWPKCTVSIPLGQFLPQRCTWVRCWTDVNFGKILGQCLGVGCGAIKEAEVPN